MTQAQLLFTSITAPPENFYYQTYFAAAAESVFVGTLKPDPKTGHAGLTWDEATRGPIPSAYQQLRIDLMRKGGASAFRMLVRSWWGDPILPGLRQLFGESRLAFQMLDEAQKLEAASLPILTASSVEVAKDKISALASQQAIWRSKATLVEVTCNNFAGGDTSLAAALSGFRTTYECAIGEADTLASTSAALLRSQDPSLTRYTSAGEELRTQAEAVRAQTEALYFFCQQFAVLRVVPMAE
jgi:hypothetical protein